MTKITNLASRFSVFDTLTWYGGVSDLSIEDSLIIKTIMRKLYQNEDRWLQEKNYIGDDDER